MVAEAFTNSARRWLHLAIAVTTIAAVAFPSAAVAKKKKTIKIVPGYTETMLVPAPPHPSSFPVTVSGTVTPYLPNGNPPKAAVARQCMTKWTLTIQIVVPQGFPNGYDASALTTVPFDPITGAYSVDLTTSFPSDKASPNYRPTYGIVPSTRVLGVPKFKLNGRKVLCADDGFYDAPGFQAPSQTVDPPESE